MEIPAEQIKLGVVWYFVFIMSTVLHEAAHAWVAKLGGDDTSAGQLTLDPTPHVRREPFGMVVVPWLSFFLGGWMIGWASVPLDPGWAHRHPVRAGWMSLAGPLANLGLVAVAVVAIRFGIAADVLRTASSGRFTELVYANSESMEIVAMFFSVLFSLNLILFVFNLLPIPPLDGATVVNVALGATLARRWQALISNPAWSLIGLLVAWNVFPRIFAPVYRLALVALR